MPIQQWSDNIWLAQLANEPMLSEDLTAIADKAQHTEPPPHIVLDFTAVGMINSSNLSQLLRIRKLANEGGSKLRVAGLRDGVWVVFLTTGLDKLFEFTGDVPTALAGLQIGE